MCFEGILIDQTIANSLDKLRELRDLTLFNKVKMK